MKSNFGQMFVVRWEDKFITTKGLRICEVRQTINLNIYKPLHGVSYIYTVSTSLKFYGLHRTC